MIRAVLGGSFDPVHHGHVALATHLLGASLADEVLVIPAGQSPHKSSSVAAPEDRLAMCHLAFDPHDNVVVDDREVLRGGRSYTVDTLEELNAALPGEEMVLVIGADNLAGFPTWRKPERIIKLAKLAIFPRDGIDISADACTALGIPPERVILVSDFDHPVSSSTVRAILAQGRVPDAQLLPEVSRYIRSHHLYGV